MANEYLISKWRMWFKCLDVRHDGKIARADVDEAESKFVHFHHLEAEKRKSILEQLDKWWAEYIFRQKPGPLSEQDFVDMQNEDFKADKEKFKERMTTCMKIIFNILDISHEGSLTEDEYVIAFRSAGHENITLDTEFFNAYKPVDGKVPVKKICESWVQFTTCEDSSIPDIVREAFEKGV